MKFLFIFISLMSVASAQTIVCKNETEIGVEEITITDSNVTVSLPLYSKPRIFTEPKQANGLITDHGLAFYSEDHFGCIRNALLIIDFREPINAGYMRKIRFDSCSGGATPDEICHPN